MDFRYYTLDVFTEKPFGGNPLAVFPDADRLPEAMMPKLARELNLSETVFVVRARQEGALRRLRVFTPGMELPFAGHPTIGTAVLLAEMGLVTFASEYAGFALELEVGVVRIRVRRRIGQPSSAQLTAAPNPKLGPPPPAHADLAKLLGISADELAGGADKPEAWSCGTPFLLVPVRDTSVLGKLHFNVAEWETQLQSFWAPHVFVFCQDSAGSNLRARMFAPAMGITEDPATGAAASALAGYLAARLEPTTGTVKWNLEQGVEMGRPSQIAIECDLDEKGVKAVRVGGSAVPVFEGLFRLP